MTDTQGNVVQSYRYDEFGRLLQEASPPGPHSNYKYTAQEYDGDISELYNYRARYYDPEIGRFTQEDPIVEGRLRAGLRPCCRRLPRTYGAEGAHVTEPQALNAYVYVANSPTNWTDPVGLDRYKACEDYEDPVLWLLCRWIIWMRCTKGTIAERIACCDADHFNCMERIGADCPEAERRMQICKDEKAKCMAGAGGRGGGNGGEGK